MHPLYKLFHQYKNKKSALFFLLLDPDKLPIKNIDAAVSDAIKSGVDGFLIGSSILITDQYQTFVAHVKGASKNCPVILFPGNNLQVSSKADALLFLSLISGRNPEYLINQQVMAAPKIKKVGIETISTAYMLISSGTFTSVEYVSNTRPIPSDKKDIAVAHALAAEMLGFKVLYLEAGSGAKKSVPNDLISAVCSSISLPIIVGGGIREPHVAQEKVASGASIIVCGNFFETNNYAPNILSEIANAVHKK